MSLEDMEIISAVLAGSLIREGFGKLSVIEGGLRELDSGFPLFRPYQSVICPSKAWHGYNLGNYFFSEICAIMPPTRQFGY